MPQIEHSSNIAVFTDLDGTLLDHQTYSYEPATEALQALKFRNIPLVLASSKTAAEMARIHAELNLGQTPAIVENGAGIFDPGKAQPKANVAYLQIRAALDTLPSALRDPYRGFGDMTPVQIADITGLSLDAAKDAADRNFSEPGLWSGDETQKAAFLNALSEQGIKARDGGRFLTLSHGRTKADAMRAITTNLNAQTTIALGDAPNDREMLETATYAVIIRNDHGPELTLDKPAKRVIRTTQEGPTGWNTALLKLLKTL